MRMTTIPRTVLWSGRRRISPTSATAAAMSGASTAESEVRASSVAAQSCGCPIRSAEAVDPGGGVRGRACELPHADFLYRRGEAGFRRRPLRGRGRRRDEPRTSAASCGSPRSPCARASPSRARSGRRRPSSTSCITAHEECYIANSVKSEVVVRAGAACDRPDRLVRRHRMRYLPLTPTSTAATCWRAIGVADIDALFADIPADKRLHAGPPDLPRTKWRDRGRARARPHGGAERRRPRRCRSSSARAPTSTTCRRASIT